MKMKSKNNWTMRAAVLMFALVLITSSFVGGTFAKYVTSGTGEDSARVAKFGVTVSATGDMFEKTYAVKTPTATVTTNSVVSTEDVVAPGTSGKMAAVTLSGTPEVAVRVSHEAKEVKLNNWEVDGAFYCPLIFKVKLGTGTETTIDGKNFSDSAALIAKIKDTVVAQSKEYNAGANLTSADAISITWEWPFETLDATGASNDGKDTKLGDASPAATVELKITTTVTQID